MSPVDKRLSAEQTLRYFILFESTGSKLTEGFLFRCWNHCRVWEQGEGKWKRRKTSWGLGNACLLLLYLSNHLCLQTLNINSTLFNLKNWASLWLPLSLSPYWKHIKQNTSLHVVCIENGNRRHSELCDRACGLGTSFRQCSWKPYCTSQCREISV